MTSRLYCSEWYLHEASTNKLFMLSWVCRLSFKTDYELFYSEGWSSYFANFVLSFLNDLICRQMSSQISFFDRDVFVTLPNVRSKPFNIWRLENQTNTTFQTVRWSLLLQKSEFSRKNILPNVPAINVFGTWGRLLSYTAVIFSSPHGHENVMTKYKCR